MLGTSQWYATVGFDLAAQTPVYCTLRLPKYADNTIGLVHTSQIVQGAWQYSVAFPPHAPGSNERSTWTLVSGINSSQLLPLTVCALGGTQFPVPDSSMRSNLKVSNFMHPQPSLTHAAPSNRPLQIARPDDKAETGAKQSVAPSAVVDSALLLQVDGAAAKTPRTQPLSVPTKGFNLCKLGVATAAAVQSNVQLSKAHTQFQQLTSKVANKPMPPGAKVTKCDKAAKQFCEHGKRKTVCVPCKGGSICIHQKQRYWCELCGNHARCIHGKQKSRCVECRGVGTCMHGKMRSRCSHCS